ncbi:epoxyqueuosine reductase [Chloroflexota bacterium]
MKQLSETVLDFVGCLGVCASGITTVETLIGGPPSADLTYVLPGAKSAICFAVPLNQNLIPPFLAKESRRDHERDNLRTNAVATGIAQQLADFLNLKGYPSIPVSANLVWRTDTPRGASDTLPPLSQRYLAVCSGVGHFGLSGNIITKQAGAAVILASTVTTAELVPTEPLPADESYCDNCGMCIASCISGFVNAKEKEHVKLGGIVFTYTKRGKYSRCGYVCGGYTGLHPSGKWSTWSPGRFAIPEDDKELGAVLRKAIMLYNQWPEVEGGSYVFNISKKQWGMCANCQLVCTPDLEERKRRHKLLVNSGVVMQNPDGSLEAVSPDEAKRRLASMSPEVRALYEEA